MLIVLNVWSTNFSVIKSILDSIPDNKLDPSIYATLRFSVAALAMFPRTNGVYKKENFDPIKNGLFLGCFNFTGYLGQSMGLQTSSANKSAFICSMVVAWVALISSIRDNNFKLKTWISVIFAMIGAGIIELNSSQLPVLGDLWLFLQPIGFGSGYLFIEPLMKKYPESVGVITSFRLITVSIISILWSIISGHDLNDYIEVLNYPQALLGLCYLKKNRKDKECMIPYCRMMFYFLKEKSYEG